MEFRILGPLEAIEDGCGLDLGGQKQRALLAVLLLEANRVVPTDRLIDALWEDEPPETAQKALQVYISQLRKIVGRERLERRAPGYRLFVEPGELDLERFARLRAEGRLSEALALWRGHPLAEFAPLRFAETERARLEELRLACLGERIDEDLESGRAHELVAELDGLVRAHPLREPLRCRLMLALYRSGRQAEALEVYQDARRVLVGELGIEPGPELRELQRSILAQHPSLAAAKQPRALEPSAEALQLARGVFVGREGELAELQQAFNDAVANRGRLVLLVGEPGIGKSRLADELVVRARARGAQVIVGRCWEAGGAPAYWPWVQSLRAHMHATPSESLRAQLGSGASDLTQLLPELRELLADIGELPTLEPESARFRLFEAVSAFLKRAAEPRPLVLVLDDLHAADEPSLLLLQFLAREIGESRLLVVGAYRNVDPMPADPLTTTLAELLREPVTRRITLAGLSESDVRCFIELTSGESPSDEFVATIHEETEGNPLFVGEIVRLLDAEGRLADAQPRPLAIPQSVRDVIARRLRHLSEDCNRVLVLASVLGREFALKALAGVAGVSEDEVLETLDEAMAARLVSDVPGVRASLRFAHVLIRDTLYEGLTTARRVRLHRTAAEALEALYGDEPGPHLAELAYHCSAGSDFAKALRYARLAGDRALSLLAYEEAARLYEAALDAGELADLTEETRCELLVSLGEAESRAGDTPSAKQAFLRAAGVARRLALGQLLARAAAGYGGRIVWARAGDDTRLVPLLEEGLTSLGAQDVELRARLSARLAGALRDEHSRRRRDSLSSEAVELARRTRNPSALAYALDGRAAAILAPDTVDECLGLGTELRELAVQIADPERIVAGHFHRLLAQLVMGDIRGATVDLDAMGRTADELRQPAQLWLVCVHRSLLALSSGAFGDTERLLPQVLELGRGELGPRAIPAYRMQRSAVLEARGHLADSEPEVRELVADYPARPVFRCALAHLHAKIGRLEEAQLAVADLARESFSSLPFDLEWLYGSTLLAETCVSLHQSEPAEELYRLLLPWSALIAVDPPEGTRGSVSRYLGLLAQALDRCDDAIDHFEDALAINERMGARPWLAHTREDYARLLLERGSQDDREKGNVLLTSALATYRELGMAGPLAKAEAMVRI
jgi:eukaryotic-like serine/threonine-protein kinase